MRQPFLDRIAFGQSAYEPTNCTETVVTSEYVQLAPDQEIPQHVLESDRYNQGYIQVYDHRGNPINPRAEAYARSLRQAQNEVLAAVGVVERKLPPSADGHVLTSNELVEQAESKELEDATGQYISLVSSVFYGVCTWWIFSLRGRILTFGLRDTLHFSQIIASHCQLSGPQIIYAGLPAFLFFEVLYARVIRVSEEVCSMFRPVDRLLWNSRVSRKTRLLLGGVMERSIRMATFAAFYPLCYHGYLQEVGMLPAWPLVPPWRSFIPFSAWSPIRLPSLQSGLSVKTVLDLTKYGFTSPLLLCCLWYSLETWASAAIRKAAKASIICPRDPNMEIGSHCPPFIRNSVAKLFHTIGWGRPLKSAYASNRNSAVGGVHVTNINRLDVPVAHIGVQHVPDLDILTVDSSQRSLNPAPLTVPSTENLRTDEATLSDQDPSSHDESTDDESLPLLNAGDVDRTCSVGPASMTYYHVTNLSTLLAEDCSTILTRQLSHWVILPLGIITLRSVASHYLRSRGTLSSSRMGLFSGLDPLSELRNLSCRSAGIMLSRAALCSALEVAIKVSIWGCQWAVTTYVGKKYFNWGNLKGKWAIPSYSVSAVEEHGTLLYVERWNGE